MLKGPPGMSSNFPRPRGASRAGNQGRGGKNRERDRDGDRDREWTLPDPDPVPGALLVVSHSPCNPLHRALQNVVCLVRARTPFSPPAPAAGRTRTMIHVEKLTKYFGPVLAV